MRIAIVSDIHDNLTAFQAVLADMGQTSPDIVLHGGDLVTGGSSPARSSTGFAICAGRVSSATRRKP